MRRRSFLKTAALFSLLSPSLASAADCTVKGRPKNVASEPPPRESDDTTRLFVIGDWGTRGKTQKRVAAAMDNEARMRGNPRAILSTGDNIYPSGVKSADDPLWASTFEKVYAQESLQVPWYAVLGNHDHRGSISAQTEYGAKNSRWNLPSRYYATEISGEGETRIAIICLDTQQLLQKQDGWKDQLEWLEGAFEEHHAADYIIVNGHHPLRSYGHYQDQTWMIKMVKPVMDKHNATAYVSGHDHDLQMIQNPNDEFLCVVSGAGASCRSTSWGKNTIDARAESGFARFSLGKDGGNVSLINTKNDHNVPHVSLTPRTAVQEGVKR